MCKIVSNVFDPPPPLITNIEPALDRCLFIVGGHCSMNTYSSKYSFHLGESVDLIVCVFLTSPLSTDDPRRRMVVGEERGEVRGDPWGVFVRHTARTQYGSPDAKTNKIKTY